MDGQFVGGQCQLSFIFSLQPAATQQMKQDDWDDIILEIEDKKERIKELRKEIGDDEEALLNAEVDEIDAEPDEGEEVLFDAVAPMLEEDLNYTRYENEAEIRTIEEEIEELEVKLKP